VDDSESPGLEETVAEASLDNKTSLNLFGQGPAASNIAVRNPELMDDERISEPQLQSDDFLRLQTAAESVFNVAIGYEYEISESLSTLGGIRSDMSCYYGDLNDNYQDHF
jgi:hypothetical protein